MDNLEIIILIAVVLLMVFMVLPSVCRVDRYSDEPFTEDFTAIQEIDTTPTIPMGFDPAGSDKGLVTPQPNSKNFENLIYDGITNTIMTSSQFMDNTALVATPWVSPAWGNHEFLGPSSKGEFDPADYENDPRLLYNKCSLSCCSPQWPTPFQNSSNPFVCDKDGNNKYYASNYMCTNNTDSSGCLCISAKQLAGFQNGWVDYYVDKENLGY